MRITRDDILAGRTPAGGWKRKQLELIGVTWPPRSGWLDRTVGLDITAETFSEFLRLRDADDGQPAPGLFD